MRVAVVGAGAVGCTFAASLDRAGHTVDILARGEQLSAIRESGLRLEGAFGDWHTTRLRALDALDGEYDLALISVKAHDARTALVEQSALNGTPLLVAQNGLDGLTLAHEILADSPAVGCLALFAASYLGPGVVTVTAAAPSFIGDGTGAPGSAAREIEAQLGETLRLKAVENFVGAQWTKLLVNQINALPAITGMSAQDVIGTRSLRRLMTRSMREAARVGVARGITFGSLQGLTDRKIRIFARLPISVGQVLPSIFASRMGPVPNPGSTLQSLRRGRRTEIDFLNGAVVREADSVGLRAPINSLLTTLVHEVEDSERFLTVDEVLERSHRLD